MLICGTINKNNNKENSLHLAWIYPIVFFWVENTNKKGA